MSKSIGKLQKNLKRGNKSMALLILYLTLTSFLGSAAQSSSTQPCGRYNDADPGFHCDATFTLLRMNDVMFTKDVLSEVSSMSKTDCGRECINAEECVMFTFQSNEKDASGRCRVYGQVHSPTEVWEESPGARSYVLDMEAFGRLHNGYFMKSGRCIRVLNEHISYEIATQRCEQLDGGHILFTKTTEDLQFGNQTMEEYGFERMWVGADDLKKEREFKWSDGSSLPIDSSLWMTGEPNNKDNQDCATLWPSSGKLDDFYCTIDPLNVVNTVCQRDV